MNARRLTPRLWGISHDPRTLRDAGIAADSLRDDSKPLAPLISELQMTLGIIVIVAAVVALIAWEVLS